MELGRRVRLARMMVLGLVLGIALIAQPSLSNGQQPVLKVSPNHLDFEGQVDEPAPGPQALTLSNTGDGILEWEASTGARWLVLGATQGALSGGRAIQLQVLVDPSGLDAGTYQTNIRIQASNAVGNPMSIPVKLLLKSSSDSPPRPINQKPLQGVRVDQGNASWTSAAPVSHVFRALLQELGADIQLQEFSSNGLAYQAIKLGDLDFWANGWFPLQSPQLPSGFFEAAVRFEPHCELCGIQGYLVDTRSIERYEITSLMDFRRPEVKRAFDANGDGRADLFGCPPGWGCHSTIEFHLDTYDLNDHIDHVTSLYSANFESARDRIERGLPALYYTWAPNSTLLTLRPGQKVKWINVVDDEDALQLSPSQAGLSRDALIGSVGNDGVTDPVLLGWVVSNIQVVANRDFIASNPAAEKLFQSVRLSLKWISEATDWFGTGTSNAEELANQWISNNRTVVNEWLQAAREAAAVE